MIVLFMATAIGNGLSLLIALLVGHAYALAVGVFLAGGAAAGRFLFRPYACYPWWLTGLWAGGVAGMVGALTLVAAWVTTGASIPLWWLGWLVTFVLAYGSGVAGGVGRWS